MLFLIAVLLGGISGASFCSGHSTTGGATLFAAVSI